MKLYKIWQSENNDWDTYSDAVVCAESEEDAKTIDPSGDEEPITNKKQNWSSWSILKHIKVEYIGEAKQEMKRGVVCASFHAG